ncbi:Nucleoside 2-deoxyribosyltransferase [Mycoplasmopsis californica]|uniref:Nucleoside 2-deoxyribosyltransferase n=1 Tax=Mycoplasmopsis equigenitalium TaxID=114883 RepID=A0ABY5J4N9_9BACT|nr:nucleoside 2-deoxyribosyltransferase [Mycoplasmopsis equigenitalium]UUD36925.1 nucleoside 2-deoxyribosyltransferase [Mycoplasmopsis equigenitalium]VEU69780.1 Nucleoside 2-deoxyribosyltransferase [Mycoplasmopsis californica]
MKRIYFANALFSQAEVMFNKTLIEKIRELKKYTVYAPQENMSINDKTKSADSVDIYRADKNELDRSDILVAVLDGLVIDPGVAAEIGIFAQSKKPILGLITDSRKTGHMQGNDPKLEIIKTKVAESQFMYFNLFVIGAIKENGDVFDNVDDLISKLKNM